MVWRSPVRYHVGHLQSWSTLLIRENYTNYFTLDVVMIQLCVFFNSCIFFGWGGGGAGEGKIWLELPDGCSETRSIGTDVTFWLANLFSIFTYAVYVCITPYSVLRYGKWAAKLESFGYPPTTTVVDERLKSLSVLALLCRRTVATILANTYATCFVKSTLCTRLKAANHTYYSRS